MRVNRTHRRSTRVVAAGLCLVGVLAAGCGAKEEPAPSSTPTTTTTPTPTPTEKQLDPTGGNLFTPQVKAPPAPTEPPGVHRHNN